MGAHADAASTSQHNLHIGGQIDSHRFSNHFFHV